MRRLALLAVTASIVGVVVSHAQTLSLLFAAHVDFPVGNSPLAIVTADFNDDQNADVAVANNESDNVSVLLGNGSGGFTETGPFAVAVGPAALAVGDVNKDTIPDLVVAADIDGVVTVLVGNGTGGFSASEEVDVGLSPDGIALGDFNNDSTPDFANTNYFDSPGSVTVALGNGDGTFQTPPLALTADGGPLGIAVGRLNNDGNDDLVVGGYDLGVVFVMLGNGDGTFQAATTHTVGAFPTGIVISDLNSDARADVAVANEDSDSVSVLLGDGDGGFAAAVQYGVGALPEGIAAADFNADGIPDLVTADYFGTASLDSSVSVLIGVGDGTFAAAQSFETNLSPFGVVAANFGGDDLPDLVSVNLDGNDVSLLINESTPVIQPAELIAGTSLIIRSGRFAKFVAKPLPGQLFSLPAVGNDPTVGGATLRIFDTSPGGAGDVTFDLDASGWTALGTPPGSAGFEYRGARAQPTDDICRRVVLKGTAIRATCRGDAMTVPLVTPFDGLVGIILDVAMDSKRYCAEYGGVPKRNDAVLTKRVDALAPAQCSTIVMPSP